MNANYKTPVPQHAMFVVLFLVSMLVACSRENPQRSDEPVVATPPAPLVMAPPPSPALQAPAQQYEMESGGEKSTYVPEFMQGQLIGITEERAAQHGPVKARYEFQGARLLRYAGASFETDAQLEIEFDLQGALISARRDGDTAPQEDIAQARAHAALLRSHALAQQATREHSRATSHSR